MNLCLVKVAKWDVYILCMMYCYIFLVVLSCKDDLTHSNLLYIHCSYTRHYLYGSICDQICLIHASDFVTLKRHNFIYK